MTNAIDWRSSEGKPEGKAFCRCGESFRTHVALGGDGKVVSKKPCPKCGATEGHKRAVRPHPSLGPKGWDG